MNNKNCGVYKITNIKNNKFYIGSSDNIYKRWKRHINYLNKGSHQNIYLQRAWVKYGEENFVFDIIEFCDEKIKFKREQYWLDFTKCYDYNVGYNISEKAWGSGMSGEKNNRAKLTNSDIIDIKQKFINGYTVDFLSDFYNVYSSTIYNILSRRTWKRVGVEYNKDIETLLSPSHKEINKLSKEENENVIKEMREYFLLNPNDSFSLISKKFNCSVSKVSDILNYNKYEYILTNEKENILNILINKEGKKGIGFRKSRNKWRAYVIIDGKQKSLGNFKTEEEAINAKLEYETKK